MLKKIAIVLAVLVVALVAFVASRPSAYHVERSNVIAAPPETVFGFVVDLREWEKWSPWEKLDPQMKKTIDGPMRDVGMKYSWEGNAEAGKGTMTLVRVDPPRALDIRLDFEEPMSAQAETGFTFAPEGDGTRVTWSMEGYNGFLGKAFGLVMDMEATIGAEYEKGLAALQELSEASVQAARVAEEQALASLTKETALEALSAELPQGCVAEGKPEEYRTCSITLERDGGSWKVQVEHDGFFDDSVRASRLTTTLTRVDGAWTPGPVEKSHRCQEGRGHQDFSSELCL
jgi:uncharacterized protein YndB with AHSA1/START domain